jgi:hypothetical protein
MEESIADGIGDAGLTNRGVPRGGRELSGIQCRRSFTPIFEDLQSVAASPTGQRRQEPVIDRQEIQFGPFCQESDIRAVAAADGELVE